MTDGRNDLTRGITAVIEGFFGMAWFNWVDRDHPLPQWLQVATIAGGVLALVAAIVGVVIAVRAGRRGEESALRDPVARRRYLIVVWLEIGVLVAGAGILGVAGLPQWTPVLVAAGVGLHFIPLSGVFKDPVLVPLGVAVMAVAVAALVTGLASDVPPANVTGPGTGLLLLIGAWLALAAPSTGDVQAPRVIPSGTVGGGE